MHPVLALWDSWAPFWHKFFSSPILQSLSNERFPGSCSLHQQSFWLLIFDQIEQVLYPCCVVTSPCCWLSSAELPIFNKCSTCRKKKFVPAKGLCSWHCNISKGLLKFSMCCGGTVTEFNTKKKKLWHTAAQCSVFPFPWQGSQKTSWHVTHRLHTEHCKAMPLQEGMEEGTRSKAVCVSGLQYCQ